MLSKNWANSFKRKHEDELKAIYAKPLERDRFELDATEVKAFYTQLSHLIEEYNVPPELYANMDETPLDFKNRKVKYVVPKDQEQVFVPQDIHHQHVTLAPCVFADGESLKPLAIIQAKHVPSEVDMKTVVAFDWRFQSKGWMTTEIWSEWITDVFLPGIRARRKANDLENRWGLLVLDGHSSRLSPEALRACQTARVHVQTYVAHSSHLCQVLDCGVFRCFKTRLPQFLPTRSFSRLASRL